MYALIIGASNETIHAIKSAKDKGIYVLAFDGDENAEGLKYADESFVVDIKDPENVIRIIDSKNIDPKDMIVLPVLIGRYLITTGTVIDHYGLMGAHKESVNICTDKWLFHETLAKQSLRDADCRLVKAGEIPSEPVRFPVIIKPRYGAGSRGVVSVSDKTEWEAEMKGFPCDEDYVVEDEVAGIEYGVDGLVMDGCFHLVFVRKKINTEPPFRQCVGYMSLSGAEAEQIENMTRTYMEKLISAAGIKTAVIHADIIIRDDDGSPFVIEMSTRPSGHRLHDVFTPLVTGVDEVSVYIDHILGRDTWTDPKKRDEVYMIRYFDIEDEIRRIPDSDQLIEKYDLLDYECNMTEGEVRKIKDGHSLMGRGYFILKEKTEGSVCEKADRLLGEYV